MKGKLMTIGALALAAACGTSEEGRTGGGNPNWDPPVDYQGDPKFARVIPTAESVTIHFGAGGASTRALDAVSPAYDSLTSYTDQINGHIEGIFTDLEEIVATTPVVEEPEYHEWRVPADDPAYEEVLVIATSDDVTFDLAMMVGPTGFDATSVSPIVIGQVLTDDTGAATEYVLDVSLDAATELDPSYGATGTIEISGHPAPGAWEIWYDFQAVSVGGEDPTTSITTYWTFDDASGALEYMGEVVGSAAMIYAHWDELGAGRWDSHAAQETTSGGIVSQYWSNCWDATGAELFDAVADVDEAGVWTGAVEGDEAACAYASLEGYPGEIDVFGDLPLTGWDGVGLGLPDDDTTIPDGVVLCLEDPSNPDCLLVCDEAPDDPTCVALCDTAPDAPDCVWYCDHVTDDPYCTE